MNVVRLIECYVYCSGRKVNYALIESRSLELYAGKKSKASSTVSKNDKIRHILTRLALAQVLIIFGIWEIVQPVYWNSFVPYYYV